MDHLPLYPFIYFVKWKNIFSVSFLSCNEARSFYTFPTPLASLFSFWNSHSNLYIWYDFTRHVRMCVWVWVVNGSRPKGKAFLFPYKAMQFHRLEPAKDQGYPWSFFEVTVESWASAAISNTQREGHGKIM